MIAYVYVSNKLICEACHNHRIMQHSRLCIQTLNVLSNNLHHFNQDKREKKNSFVQFQITK